LALYIAFEMRLNFSVEAADFDCDDVSAFFRDAKSAEGFGNLRVACERDYA
jgi:hypothetical protein